jgi:hypothetical protein
MMIMKKAVVLVFIVLIAANVFASMSMSYANDNFIVLVGYDSWDNDDDGKNVGEVSASIDLDGTLSISILGAYPGYEAYVNFTIKNLGYVENPILYLREIDISNPPVLDVAVTYLNGDPILMDTPLDSGEILEGLVTVTVLSGVDELQSYNFDVDIIFTP